jgi:hypothetical protein
MIAALPSMERFHHNDDDSFEPLTAKHTEEGQLEHVLFHPLHNDLVSHVAVVETLHWWLVVKALILCWALHKSVKLVFPLMVEVFRLFHEMRSPLVMVPIVNPIPTKVQ